ncbi:MAG: filamentous hemagglutinin N-terminal domain-containing protein [Microcoleaceae cyanobacterium]
MNKSLPFILSTSLVFLNLNSYKANAQIVPDNTLGSEKSIVNPINSQRRQIEGGAIRGSNLFHSFQEFNIQNGTSVYFAHPIGIENILSRVTGNNPSNIFGTLGVLGEANTSTALSVNLFLINPNGIIFGPNARLDLRGSFFASTADSIRLGENGEFSATQPNNNTLLTVNPSALFINQLPLGNSNLSNSPLLTGEGLGERSISNSPGERLIINQSTADGVGLQVQPGQTLGLIGGNIIIDGGILTAEQGIIELGSIGNNSTVTLNQNNTNFTLDYSEVNQFQDIQLSNNALIDVSGEGGGSVQIQGRNISLTESSLIQSNTLGSEQGGTLKVNAEHLQLQEGSLLITATFNSGSGANLNINAQKIEAVGLSPEGTRISGIFSDVVAGSSGIGGDITINTEQLYLLDGAQLGANVFGAGKGGNITVNADNIEVDGVGFFQTSDPQQLILSNFLNGQFPSGILAIVEPQATGDGGNININTEQLTIRNGAATGTATIGAGNAGNLNVTANEINIIGNAAGGFPFSNLISTVVSPFGTGDGGDINLETERLTVQNGAQIRAGTSGVGDSGDITVYANEIEIIGSSDNELFPSSILADVENLDNLFPGAIGSGNGGNISIETERLTLLQGGRVSAATSGVGDGGNININATESIKANGVSPDGEFVSGLFNSLASGSSGHGGNITINTPIFSLTAGGSIGGNVFSNGDGGDITVNANVIEIIGGDAARSTNPQQQQVIEFIRDQIPSTISTSVFPGGTGTGGDITLDTQQLTIQAGATVSAGTFGAGNSGNLSIQADNIEISGVATTGFPPSNISTGVTSPTAIGKGGDLNIEAQRITLTDGGSIQSGTSGIGDSGDMMIRAGEIELSSRSVDGIFPSSISTSVQDLSAFIPGAIGSGNAGNLTINSDSITLTDGAEISASTFGSGEAGNISIDSSQIQLDNSLISVNSGANAVGTVGGITIDTENLTLTNSAVETVTLGLGDAGNIRVNANNITASGVANDPVFPTDPENNQFLAGIRSIVGTTATGNSGDITVDTQQLTLSNGGVIASVVRGAGDGGDVNVDAENIDIRQTVTATTQDPLLSAFLSVFNNQFNSGLSTTVFPGGSGDGGNLSVNASTISLQESGIIGAGTIGMGDSGSISIRASDIEVTGSSPAFPLPSIVFTSAFFGASGQGGDILIETDHLSLRDGGQIRAGTSGLGDSGNIAVIASEIELIGRSSDLLFPSSILTNVESFSILVPDGVGKGNGGNLYVESDRITLTNGGEITASTFGSGNAGNILVNAREIEASGVSVVNDIVIPTGLRVDVLPGSSGNGGNLTVNTDRLTLRDGGQLSTNMFSSSETVQSGNLTVNANVIEATGVSVNSPSGLITNVQNGASGSAGTLKVNAERISLTEGAEISSLIAGTGSGGNIEVHATEIEAVGLGIAEATNPIEEQILLFLGGVFPSGILTTVLPTATGQGGNLTVSAERITVKDSAQLGTGTFGTGNSGDLRVEANEINISGLSVNGFPPTSIQTAVLGGNASGDGGNATIEAQRINLRDGGQIRSGTSGSGNSGNLTVIAPEIELSGTSFDGRFPSSILTEVEDFSDVPPGVIGSGDGGSLTIESNRILVEDGAAITTSSFGEGAAGSLAINANSVEMNQGIISAETAIGTEGNISLNTQQLRLNNNSLITTNAMTEATGGNINIDTEIAVLAENSQISANAVEGQGGNIELNAEVLFSDNNSQITATSAFGIDGNVELNTFNDFTQEVVNLPSEIIDINTLVSQNLCQPTEAEIAAGSSLVISGRGGLPPNPTEPLTALQGLVEWETAPQQQGNMERQTQPISITEAESKVVIRYPTQQHSPIRQAQGWIATTTGDIVLTETPPTVTPQGVQLPHPDCAS